MTLITRRSALRGIGSLSAISAAVAVPVAVDGCEATLTPETPQERVQRLFRALAEALDDATPDLAGWQFHAFSRRPPFADWLQGTSFHAHGVSYEFEPVVMSNGTRLPDIRTERHLDIGFGRKWA